MIIELSSRDGGYRTYIIEWNGKHYGATHNVVTDRWEVINTRGHSIAAHSSRWEKIVSACEAHFQDIEFGAGEDARTPDDHQPTETGSSGTLAGHA